MGRVRGGAWAGLLVGLVAVGAALLVPPLLGWEVWARSMGGGVPPLHGVWRPTLIGPGTVPALLLAVLSWRYAVDLADRLPWPWLLLASYGAGLAWLLSLALVDGVSGLTRTMDHGYDYLHTAREVTDVRAVLATYVDRIPHRQPRPLDRARGRAPARGAAVLRRARAPRPRWQPRGRPDGHRPGRDDGTRPCCRPCGSSGPRRPRAGPRRSWSSPPRLSSSPCPRTGCSPRWSAGRWPPSRSPPPASAAARPPPGPSWPGCCSGAA